jgi:chemotaxis protein CheD
MIRIVSGQEILGLGEHVVRCPEGTLAALGLGSCIAVILHDPEAQVGAMAHVVLPSQSLSKVRDRPGRFPETAVPLLLTEMKAQGAQLARVTARLVGGASMFGSLVPAGTMHMGQRNVMACRAAVRVAGLQVFAESVGGERGRSVWFDVASGLVTVRSVGDEPVQL